MDEINIVITPKEKGETVAGVETSQPEITESVDMIKGALLSKIPQLGGIIVIATTAYKTAKEARERIMEFERESRNRADDLRKMGGAGFTPISVGERSNILTGKYAGGTNVAYKRR